MDLENSRLSGAIGSFPKDELDFDPDWEIDPKDVKLMDKLGQASSAHPPPSLPDRSVAG